MKECRMWRASCLVIVSALLAGYAADTPSSDDDCIDCPPKNDAYKPVNRFDYVWTDARGGRHIEKLTLPVFTRLLELKNKDPSLPAKIFMARDRYIEVREEVALIQRHGADKEDPIYWANLQKEHDELIGMLSKYLPTLQGGVSDDGKPKQPPAGYEAPDPGNPWAPNAYRKVIRLGDTTTVPARAASKHRDNDTRDAARDVSTATADDASQSE